MEARVSCGDYTIDDDFNLGMTYYRQVFRYASRCQLHGIELDERMLNLVRSARIMMGGHLPIEVESDDDDDSSDEEDGSDGASVELDTAEA